MGLLADIQGAVLQEQSDIAPILLKLRMLAARLGSESLAEWVKHESEGYPQEVEVPDYRILGVSYRATFSGPFGSGINNAPISPYLIEKYAGRQWTRYEMRQSIAAVDELLSTSEKGGSLQIEASNLILLLQGKVYEDYACNSVTGTISRASLAAIRHAVLNRILELTLEIEKSVPEAANVSLANPGDLSGSAAGVTTQIAQQIIYGNYTSVSAQSGAVVSISIDTGNKQALSQYLVQAGIPADDAGALADLASSEKPESVAEPMGPKVKDWLLNNLKKAAGGTWKIGLSVATDVIKEALLRYYGLK
ncbi:hypothetical protein [Pseudoxanthomonas sp. PXM02]|uniref:AbiTii domain-containing protein n=1 Tax=Pseudoxanthomonas sp. PXM02 TaxID=2769294 RepID=UPI0017830A86|nr:hypothetical protein [Pseudoxanthomonas sp. PXM02]